ncbi:MAG TPA: histidine ammonia-lyase [Gemmatimonadaceae bacterium]
MTKALSVDGNSLTLRDLVRVARERTTVRLDDQARIRMQRVRDVVDRKLASGEAVYGVNTGFGKLSEMAIPPDRLAELQVNLVRSHAAGVGPLLPEEEVRAMMLLRANVLAKGHSGVRPELAEFLLAMLNAGLFPPIPEQGSVGASGDLAPLSHLALSLIGEGDLCTGQRRGEAATLLAERGLRPVELGPKEGVALVNGTQAHTAVGALALADAQVLWNTAHVAGAASLEALMGTPVAFDERIHEVRGQEGQMRSAAVLRQLLAGSEIRESHRVGDPRVQDAYALRCMPQVHGPVLDLLRFAGDIIGREINAATDNPLVFADGALLSGGNFHGQAVAMVLDMLAIGMTNLAVIAERRIDRLVHPDLNQGLPPFLTQDAGVSSGYMIAQVTAAALASECKVLSHPASVDSIPTDGNKEDMVPMAMGAAWKLRRVVSNVRHILAIELLCASQGIDFRRPLRSSAPVERAHSIVRGLVPSLDRDRPVSPDIVLVAGAIAERRFSEIAGSVL